MTAQWHFNQPKPGDKNREPVLGKFFATEAISNAAEALIREGQQTHSTRLYLTRPLAFVFMSRVRKQHCPRITIPLLFTSPRSGRHVAQVANLRPVEFLHNQTQDNILRYVAKAQPRRYFRVSPHGQAAPDRTMRRPSRESASPITLCDLLFNLHGKA